MALEDTSRRFTIHPNGSEEERAIRGHLHKPFIPEGIKAAAESAPEMNHAHGS